MAPKAIDARKCFTRIKRFSGHGPLLQKHDGAVFVGGAHGPESGGCEETRPSERTPSRPWRSRIGRMLLPAPDGARRTRGSDPQENTT